MRLALGCCLFLVGSSAVADPTFTVEIKESAMNKLAARLPAPKWDGRLLLVPGTPISPATRVVWKSSVRGLNFNATSSGITLRGQLRTRYALKIGDQDPADSAYLTFDQDFQTGMSVSFTGSHNLRFRVSSTARLPIRVSVPGFGHVDLFTIETEFPGVRIDYDLDAPFRLSSPKGRAVRARVFGLSREYGANKVIVRGQVRFW
jgi:hypothetical protein